MRLRFTASGEARLDAFATQHGLDAALEVIRGVEREAAALLRGSNGAPVHVLPLVVGAGLRLSVAVLVWPFDRTVTVLDASW